MENEPPRPPSDDEQIASPTGSLKRQGPPLKDATKVARKKCKSENVLLPTNDVRGSYHRILETIFNGCHKTVAMKHLKSMCTDDCVLVIRSVNNPFGPNYREVRSIDSMVEWVDTALEAVPDLIFNITDSKFYRKPQNESMIISSFTANGRMIYTIETLKDEDVEDLDSAISGLQMLYQGGSGGDASTQDETVQLVCEQMESAASKIEASNASSAGTGAAGTSSARSSGTKSTDSLYSFVYPTHSGASAAAPDDKLSNTTSTISSDNSSGSLPISALAEAAAARAHVSPSATAAAAAPPPGVPTVEPFDYSAKFSHTGASLFEPRVALGAMGIDDEEDDLADIGMSTAVAALGESLRPSLGSASTDTVVVKEEGGGLTLRPISGSAGSLVSLTPPLTGLTLGTGNATSTGTGAGTGNFLAPISTQHAALHSSTNAPPSAASLTTTATAAAATGAGAAGAGTAGGLTPTSASSSSSSFLTDLAAASSASAAGKEVFWLKHRSNVMIVKESAKFCLKEKIPPSKQVYKVKGTMTLSINSDKRIRRIELLNSYDTSMHR